MNMRNIPIAIMGLTSILMQITAMRELLTVFSGNELDIGITLSVWLTAVGIGSYGGYRLRFGNAFAISFLLVGFLLQPTILFIGLIRPLFPFELGETISLTTTLIFTIISLLPLCLVIGFLFPLAVSYLEGNTAKVYSLEAGGAFIGGALFTLLLSGRIDAFALSAAVSIINLTMAVLLLRKKSLIVILLIPIAFYFGFTKINSMLQWKGLRLIERVESRYGEIAVLKLREQTNVYSSGRFQFSYPDPQTEELRTHLPMSIHPSPFHILVIGGSPAVLRELLKYPVSKIDFLEIDPKIIDVSWRLLGVEDREVLKDKRARIITEDARRFVKRLHTADYDLVILNLPEPSTANINRFYTTDFFAEVKAVLKENGIFSLTLPTSSGYIGRRMQVANGSIYNSIKGVFKFVEVSSEEYGYIFASESLFDISTKTLTSRFSKRAIKTGYLQTYILEDAFSPLKINMVRERFEKITIINRDLMPVAYLYNLMLWAEVHGGRILNYLLELKGWQTAFAFISALMIVAIILWKKRQQAVYFSMFTTGYSAMAFSMIVILTYQALYGYVYEMIGLLTAIFMIGMACGAYIIKGAQMPLRWLRLFETAAIMIFISTPLFLNNEPFFYTLNMLCGMIAGAQFATANLCLKEQETVRKAGRLYGTDLVGSFFGALITAIFSMPLLGVQNTLLFLILIKGISLALLFSIGHEKT